MTKHPESIPPGSQRGRFIVVEGIDGAGSTTHAKRLYKSLRADGHDVRLTCEPTTGPIGGMIRQVLQNRLMVPDAEGPRPFAWSTMALLFAADRLDHLDSFVVPALRDGATVISDRYDLSSVAYQSVTAPGGIAVVPWIRELNARALRPDLTLIVDVPPKVAAARRAKRGGSEELFESTEIQSRLCELYSHAEELVPGDKIVRISGEGEIDDVAANLLDAARTLFVGG